MKYLIGLLTVCSVTFGWAQTPVNVHVSGNIFNTEEDSVYLSQYFGTHYKDYLRGALQESGDFNLKGQLPVADYYVLRIGTRHINLILRDEADIKVYGDGKQLDKFTNILGSQESASLQKFAYLADVWTKRRDSAIAIIQKDPSQAQTVNGDMQHHLVEFQNEYRTFITENQNSPALIAVLSVVDPTNDFASYESIVKQLNASFPQSPTIQKVYGAYTELKKKKDAGNPFATGTPAPDFTELMLDRKTSMSLSDLKGKIVLLDFWASWCGPCRKENPNVVRLYEKYKDRGFTVMSVSLDDNLDRWKQAIEADNLSWPNHVSDLKKWSSAAAQKYQVRGIPFTVLIDQEGKIIQTNLRGPALEQALVELLGE